MKIISLTLSAAVAAAFLWAIIGIIAGNFSILEWHWGLRLTYSMIVFMWVIRAVHDAAKEVSEKP